MRWPPSPVLAVALVLSVTAVIGASHLVPGAVSPEGDGRPVEYHVLTIVIRDGQTDEEVPARCSVVDAAGQPFYPLPPQSGFYHAPYGMAPGYFYSRGRSSLFVPEGFVAIMLSRGFEHETVIDTVGVRHDTTVTFHVDRWIDMNSLGLYSGDCHTHAHHSGGIYDVYPSDALMIAQAEGLNVINCLDQDYCFTGGPDTCSTPDCIVYMTEEHRSRVYGHSDLLGLSTLVEPVGIVWWPLLMDVADEVHAQEGAAIISAHPVSTDDFFDIESFAGTMLARELPIDVAKYKIDGYELLSGAYNSHRRTIEMWYRLLNCGFRLPPCTGTDSGLSAASGKPPGSYRTYVQVQGDFSYDSWLSGLVAGRTFATNGPLFTRFEVRNFAMGDSVNLATHGVTYLDGSVRVECETPLTRVDILCNGEIDQTFYAGEGQCVIDTSFIVTVTKSSWIAARSSGPKVFATTEGDSLHAHSGPVYFSLNGERIVEPPSALEIVDWIVDFERLALLEGEWTVPGQSLRLFAETAAALAYYSALAAGAATGVEGGQPEDPPGTAARLELVRPNPFSSEAGLGFSVPVAGHVRLSVYAPSGRLVRTLVDERLPAGRHAAVWDGVSSNGTPCSSGVYLCRLETGPDAVNRKLVLMR